VLVSFEDLWQRYPPTFYPTRKVLSHQHACWCQVHQSTKKGPSINVSTSAESIETLGDLALEETLDLICQGALPLTLVLNVEDVTTTLSP
jgi:hypothetical protein